MENIEKEMNIGLEEEILEMLKKKEMAAACCLPSINSNYCNHNKEYKGICLEKYIYTIGHINKIIKTLEQKHKYRYLDKKKIEILIHFIMI